MKLCLGEPRRIHVDGRAKAWPAARPKRCRSRSAFQSAGLFVNRADAETIALRAVEWMASEGTMFERFLNESGETAAGVQRRLGDAEFLASALDHLLMSDDAVISFCSGCDLPFESPAAARRALPGGDAPAWT